jgi:uncharacterized lipoprotein YmbA
VKAFAYIIFLTAIVSGCASSPPSRFYVLSERHESGAAQGAPLDIGVVVGPTSIPDSVDRPQIVVQFSENEVTIAEHARWAEPLGSAIPNVMARDLSWTLNPSRLAVYPQSGDAGAFRISIDVLQFVSQLGDAATLEIAWTIYVPERNKPISRRTLVRERVDGPGYEALVQAHSRALAHVSAEIADAIRDLRS